MKNKNLQSKQTARGRIPEVYLTYYIHCEFYKPTFNIIIVVIIAGPSGRTV